MKIVFMGTPDFAVPCLEICHAMGEVVGVFTQPDRPKGRGKKLAPPPVKEKAMELGLEIFQPEKIKTKESVEVLKSLAPDLIIVVAYGQILSTEILEMPLHGCINVHASLLPKLRGASPINWSIVTGETVTGVTTMYMSEGLDEGDMLSKIEIGIDENMTAGVLHDLLMDCGSKVLRETLVNVQEGTVVRVPQDHAFSNYAPILKKEMGFVNWEKSAHEISCLIRGFDPWPVAYTKYEGQVMKLYSPQHVDKTTNHKAGTVVSVDKLGMLVQTGEGALIVKEIQMPNGKRMPVSSYILGHEIRVGTLLGE